MTYNRADAVAYAHAWALRRNPNYYNFDHLGGDCTNFCSQCLLAGAGTMNHIRDTGWYYTSANSRSAAWSGVEFLHRFLVSNKGIGPYATELSIASAQPGDIIQLSFDGTVFKHSLFVVENKKNILIATHTYDADNRPLGSYQYVKHRLIHIEGVRR